jgi:hypothetical protein
MALLPRGFVLFMVTAVITWNPVYC